MAVPQKLASIFTYIGSKQEDHIKLLAESVAIKSVSAWPETRKDVIEMVHWFAAKLETVGAKLEIAPNPLVSQQTPEGQTLELPPIILGTLGNDPKKKTLVIYGHLDVQPAAKEDGWNTEPFVLTEIDGKLWGRGSTDDKGPVLGWLIAIQAYQALGIDIPVNLKVSSICKLYSHNLTLICSIVLL